MKRIELANWGQSTPMLHLVRSAVSREIIDTSRDFKKKTVIFDMWLSVSSIIEYIKYIN